MVTFQSIRTEDEIEFERGHAAYYAGQESIVGQCKAFREGYEQAWREDNRMPEWKDPEGSRIDQAWEAHVDAM